MFHSFCTKGVVWKNISIASGVFLSFKRNGSLSMPSYCGILIRITSLCRTPCFDEIWCAFQSDPFTSCPAGVLFLMAFPCIACRSCGPMTHCMRFSQACPCFAPCFSQDSVEMPFFDAFPGRRPSFLWTHWFRLQIA